MTPKLECLDPARADRDQYRCYDSQAEAKIESVIGERVLQINSI